MNAFARGDVFWADLPEGRAHPVLIVTRQAAIPIRSSVTVVLVTSTSRGHPAEVSLDVEDGFAHPSVANCDEIYTISKSRLTERWAQSRSRQCSGSRARSGSPWTSTD